MKCIICGADLVENAVFCGNCGNAVVKESSAEEVREIVFEEQSFAEEKKEEVAPAPQKPAKKSKEKSEEKAPKKKNPGTLLGILGLVLGLLGLATGSLCTCAFSIVGSLLPLVLAVAGIILAFAGISKSKKAGCKNVWAIIAIIVSALAVGSILLLVVANVVLDLTGLAEQLKF